MDTSFDDRFPQIVFFKNTTRKNTIMTSNEFQKQGVCHTYAELFLCLTGVDWKSLTIPACLPLTTDYFPDERSLVSDYLVSDYSLLPDDVNADYSSQRARPLSTKEVFFELVSQRLAQGFQCVIRTKYEKTPAKQQTSFLRVNSPGVQDGVEEHFLSGLRSCQGVYDCILMNGCHLH